MRADLPTGLQMAQAIHAAFLFSQEHPDACRTWMRDSQYLVVVAVPDETALLTLSDVADARSIPHALWHEPDLPDPCDGHHQATALALTPTPAARRLCANLPLAGRQVTR